MRSRLANSNERIAKHYRFSIIDFAAMRFNSPSSIANALFFANRNLLFADFGQRGVSI